MPDPEVSKSGLGPPSTFEPATIRSDKRICSPGIRICFGSLRFASFGRLKAGGGNLEHHTKTSEVQIRGSCMIHVAARADSPVFESRESR
jgi:hypothetical protein